MEFHSLLDKRRLVAGIFSSLLLAVVLMVVVIQAIFASPLAADLNGSSKSVNRSEAFPGQVLRYTVVISNSGDTAVQNAVLTDTLPASLTYNTDTLTYTIGSDAVTAGYGENAGIITWTGTISPQGYVTLNYQAALTETLQSGEVVANSVSITGTGELITRMASTTIITSSTTHFPIMFKPVPVPVLNAIVRPSIANEWTASWNDVAPEITGYELQEDSDTKFSSPTTYDVGLDLSRTFNPSESVNNTYCYRVRAKINTLYSSWSNVSCINGNYYDGFGDYRTGWAIRRQDTDDTNNSTYYKDGHFVTKIAGRWDYAIAAPMAAAPEPPYQIGTRALFADGADNLHSYGIIFGGDWNGQPCPVDNYSSCFTHYYRLNVIWYGANTGALRVELKRIDYHDASNNSGRGVSLTGYLDVPVGDPSGWNDWVVHVHENGMIQVFSNGRLIITEYDTTYVNEPYFGVFASADEYLGTAATFDFYQISAIP